MKAVEQLGLGLDTSSEVVQEEMETEEVVAMELLARLPLRMRLEQVVRSMRASG